MARAVLIGLPGSGKSTLARSLAADWGCDAVDTDEVLSASVGCSAAEFLRTKGEEAFRREEVAALGAALVADAVVATGGGVVVSSDARALLAAELTVWLDCEDKVLLERVAEGERPLLGADPATALARLRAEREGWYREVATLKVDTSGGIDEALDRLRDALERSA
ncbi:MAG TPA: shikimate kinase [Acidimicrobiales bacterium]|nr:shikimate kinase [Acidimicrobiales bacterium]